MEVDGQNAEFAEGARLPRKPSVTTHYHSCSTRATGTGTGTVSCLGFDSEFNDDEFDVDNLMEDCQDGLEAQSDGAREEPQFGGLLLAPSKGGDIFDCFSDEESDHRGGFFDRIGTSFQFEEEILEKGPLSEATGAFEDSSDIASHFERLWGEGQKVVYDMSGQTPKLRSISYEALPMVVQQAEVMLAFTPPAGSRSISAEHKPDVSSSSSSSTDQSAPRQFTPARDMLRQSAPRPRAPARHILRLSSEHIAALGADLATPAKSSGSEPDSTEKDFSMSGAAGHALLRLRRLGSAEVS
mmetsp:Transcript_113222/g.366111  ORF Transcript_113222/g.366111 Transcript_113222/m.366111 type:complete len:298 (+) Transcript_113222:55-948(+)